MKQWGLLIFPWLAWISLAVTALWVLHRPLGRLFRLVLRSAGGLAALVLLHPVGPLVGVTLGVNWVNALVLGVLGIPGFGLLLMLQWVLQAP